MSRKIGYEDVNKSIISPGRRDSLLGF